MKNLLFEMDQSIQLAGDEYWITEDPGIYKTTYSWNAGSTTNVAYGLSLWGFGLYGEAGTTSYSASANEPVIKIGSFFVDGNNYTPVDTYDDLFLADETFYFDKTTQVLYVRFLNEQSPGSFAIVAAGVTKGYGRFARYYSDVYYDSRVLSVPNLKYTKDPVAYGVISTDSFEIELINEDHHFDMLDQLSVYGNPIRIYYGDVDDEYDDFIQVFAGFFQEFKISGNTCTIVGADTRKKLTRSIPTRSITKDDYPFLQADEVIVPVCYGIIEQQICIALDSSNDSLSSYRFMFMDTTHHSAFRLGNVYVNGRRVTQSSEDLNEGIFTLSNAVYEVGDEVTCDLTGSTITNPLAIIQDVLELYGGIDYNALNYNISEWEAARDSIVFQASLNVTEDTKLKEIIEFLSTTVFGSLIIESTGLINFKIRDADAAVVETYEPIDYLKPPKAEFKTKEFFTSIKVLYNQQYASETWDEYEENSRETELYTTYKSYRTQIFETGLIDRFGAEILAESIYPQYAGVFPTFTIVVDLESIDIELEDNIDAYLYVLQDGSYGSVKLEVIGITYDFNKKQKTIVGRYLDYNFDINQAVQMVRKAND